MNILNGLSFFYKDLIWKLKPSFILSISFISRLFFEKYQNLNVWLFILKEHEKRYIIFVTSPSESTIMSRGDGNDFVHCIIPAVS